MRSTAPGALAVLTQCDHPQGVQAGGGVEEGGGTEGPKGTQALSDVEGGFQSGGADAWGSRQEWDGVGGIRCGGRSRATTAVPPLVPLSRLQSCRCFASLLSPVSLGLLTATTTPRLSCCSTAALPLACLAELLPRCP